MTNGGKLNYVEVREFFDKIGIRLSLMTTYNPEANGKIERGDGPILRPLKRHAKVE